MKGFEYKFVSAVFGITNEAGLQNALNKLGADGWELVAVVPLFPNNKDKAIGHQYYFKREI